jgi:hypothetical protein
MAIQNDSCLERLHTNGTLIVLVLECARILCLEAESTQRRFDDIAEEAEVDRVLRDAIGYNLAINHIESVARGLLDHNPLCGREILVGAHCSKDCIRFK